MDKQKLIQRLMTTFLEELEEHVRALNQDLLFIEKNRESDQTERLRILFRTAHSLKGAARSVDVHLIEGACHRLEDILERLRNGRLELSSELFALLFATVDGIEEAGMRLREQQDLQDAPLVALFPRLEAASALGALFAPPVNAVPAPRRPSSDAAKVVEKEIRSAPLPPSAPLPEHSPAVVAASSGYPHMGVTLHGEAPAGGGSLRVSADKLDTLLARLGELLVARRRVKSRLGELEAVQEFVDQWRTEWQSVAKVFETVWRDNKLGNRVDNARAAHLDGRELRGARVSKRAAQLLGRTAANLHRLHKHLERLSTVMKGDSRLLEQVTGPLEDEVRQVRMLPFAEAGAGLDRMVRDLAQSEGKDVELHIQGGSVELDRSILEGLKDPLRHLVRNGIDHGLEAPQERVRTGKPRCGRIEVSAALRGSQVEVIVQDDGRGLDVEALRAQARRRGLAEPADDRDLVQMLFLPGYSTAPIITDISGRGVGLDVVKSRVESLHGTVDLSFVPGAGTRFTLTVPLTLTTLRVVLVRAAGQTYGFVGTNVHKLVRITASQLRSMAGRDVLPLSGTPLPFASLSAVLKAGADPVWTDDAKIPVLIVAAGEKRMAFAVDEFVAEQEILIKGFGTRIRRLALAAGATLLPSGQIALVLNAANLMRNAQRQAPLARVETPGKAAPVARNRLLVVEDSVTTRTLEKSILEAAGYEVVTAVDGLAAWQYLQDNDVDLVVSDVEMPNMTGFELTQAVRGWKKQPQRHLPVVLVTSRESEQDKAHGVEVGADAYLAKSAFDQRNLLETISQLL